MLITLRGISKTYRIGVETIHALREIDLDIGDNEFVAIMGSSGSGKSTLMNVLGCLDRPTAGEYRLDERRTDRMSASELAMVRNERIGFVFQAFELLARSTALRNVELPSVYARGDRRRDRRSRALSALDRVGLADRVHHRPNQLSGGQKQRVAIARALLNRPAILLADEPTGNLDGPTGQTIMDLLFGLNERHGATLVLVTHAPELAARCSRTIRLEDGRLSMNYEGKVCAFDDVEGASCQVLSERASGHPVGVPGRGDLVVTDTYAKEHAAFGLEAGEAALRVLSGGDREAWLGVFPVAALGTMPTDVWRCDAHPDVEGEARRRDGRDRLGRAAEAAGFVVFLGRSLFMF